uniref:G-protein coupled receptors family 1 profile domain-containing protein n=1 Tax=Erpetoichthys calabaricus TaxID=27687 RepID=A0A8C4RHD1_ERPCA
MSYINKCCQDAQWLCPQSVNLTCSKYFRSVAVSAILYFIFIIGIILAVCGNLALIISISHFKQLHTPTNILILSMAVADFFIGIISMPVLMMKTMQVCWYSNYFVCLFDAFSSTTVSSCSEIHLLFLAVDRFYSIYYPLLYSVKITFSVVWIFVIISWIGPFIYEVLLFYLLLQVPKYCQNNCMVVLIMLIVAVDWFLTFVLPFSVMICLYGKIFTVAKRHIKTTPCAELQGDSAKQTTAKTSWKRQNKATKTIGIVISVFVICWTPNYLCNIMISFIHIPTIAINAVILLGLFNSAFNPLIYGFFYPWFWKAFKVIISSRSVLLSMRFCFFICCCRFQSIVRTIVWLFPICSLRLWTGF